MERIKDFLYEKSDIFFASIVVVLVTTVVLYNLNGWLLIDSEASRYHDVSTSHNEKPATTPLADKKEKEGTSPTQEKKTENSGINKKDADKSSIPQQQKSGSENGNNAQPTNPKKEDNKKAEEERNKAESQKKAEEQKKAEAQRKADEQKKAQTQKKAEETKKQKPKQSSSNRTITIASGSTAKAIANSLQSQGFISDSNSFLNKLASSGKETKLKAGTFTIPEGSSPDQIISILTR